MLRKDYNIVELNGLFAAMKKDMESFMHKTDTAIDNLTARMDRVDTAEHGE